MSHIGTIGLGFLDNKESWESLHKALEPQVVNVVVRHVTVIDDREDLLQEIMLDLWIWFSKIGKRYSRFVDRIEGLVYSIARNKIFDYQRERIRRYEIEEKFAEMYDLVSHKDSNARVYFSELMSHLSVKQQEVIYRRMEGYSHREIGEYLSSSEVAAKNIYHRAFRILRAAWRIWIGLRRRLGSWYARIQRRTLPQK